MASGSQDYWPSLAGGLLALLTIISDAMGDTITLSELTDVQAALLAKLTGIDISLLDGGDVLNALDALDGTMDGRLTLAELNTSAVKTNLDTAITDLVAIMAKLDTSITNLATLVTQTIGLYKTSDVGRVGTTITWSFPSTILRKIMGSWGERIRVTFRSHPANDIACYIGHDNGLSDIVYDHKLEALDSWSWETQGEVWIRTYEGGNCTLYVTDAG